MINRELFNDPKDHTIAQLRMAINRFKKYDNERKAFYQGVLAENEWLKERLERAILLDPDEEPTNLEQALLNAQAKLTAAVDKHKELNRQISDLTAALTHYHLFSELSPKELAEWKANLELAKHEQQLIKANADNDRLRKANSELACQLERLRRAKA